MSLFIVHSLVIWGVQGQSLNMYRCVNCMPIYYSQLDHMTGLTYIRVCEDDGDMLVELPLEEDGTLLLATLTAQFPRCTGLKYKVEESGCFRGLRLADDRIYPPPDNGWHGTTFYCVFPKGECYQVFFLGLMQPLSFIITNCIGGFFDTEFCVVSALRSSFESVTMVCGITRSSSLRQ